MAGVRHPRKARNEPLFSSNTAIGSAEGISAANVDAAADATVNTTQKEELGAIRMILFVSCLLGVTKSGCRSDLSEMGD